MNASGRGGRHAAVPRFANRTGRPRPELGGEGPARNGSRSSRARVRRPCARLGSHPRASAGPLLRLDDRPGRSSGIDDARLRSPQAAEARRFASRKRRNEAAGAAASARGRQGQASAIRAVAFAGPALVSGRIPARARGPCSASTIAPGAARGSTTRACGPRRRPTRGAHAFHRRFEEAASRCDQSRGPSPAPPSVALAASTAPSARRRFSSSRFAAWSTICARMSG